MYQKNYYFYPSYLSHLYFPYSAFSLKQDNNSSSWNHRKDDNRNSKTGATELQTLMVFTAGLLSCFNLASISTSKGDDLVALVHETNKTQSSNIATLLFPICSFDFFLNKQETYEDVNMSAEVRAHIYCAPSHKFSQPHP